MECGHTNLSTILFSEQTQSQVSVSASTPISVYSPWNSLGHVTSFPLAPFHLSRSRLSHFARILLCEPYLVAAELCAGLIARGVDSAGRVYALILVFKPYLVAAELCAGLMARVAHSAGRSYVFGSVPSMIMIYRSPQRPYRVATPFFSMCERATHSLRLRLRGSSGLRASRPDGSMTRSLPLYHEILYRSTALTCGSGALVVVPNLLLGALLIYVDDASAGLKRLISKASVDILLSGYFFVLRNGAIDSLSILSIREAVYSSLVGVMYSPPTYTSHWFAILSSTKALPKLAGEAAMVILISACVAEEIQRLLNLVCQTLRTPKLVSTWTQFNSEAHGERAYSQLLPSPRASF